MNLDNFILGGDYNTWIEMECTICPLFVVTIPYPAYLPDVIAKAEEHNKEKHVEVQ